MNLHNAQQLKIPPCKYVTAWGIPVAMDKLEDLHSLWHFRNQTGFRETAVTLTTSQIREAVDRIRQVAQLPQDNKTEITLLNWEASFCSQNYPGRQDLYMLPDSSIHQSKTPAPPYHSYKTGPDEYPMVAGLPSFQEWQSNVPGYQCDSSWWHPAIHRCFWCQGIWNILCKRLAQW